MVDKAVSMIEILFLTMRRRIQEINLHLGLVEIAKVMIVIMTSVITVVSINNLKIHVAAIGGDHLLRDCEFVTCLLCQNQGHIAIDCPHRHKVVQEINLLDLVHLRGVIEFSFLMNIQVETQTFHSLCTHKECVSQMIMTLLDGLKATLIILSAFKTNPLST